jgi:hypothetical protein
VRRPEGVWVVMVGSSLEPSLAALARVRAGLVLGGAVLVLLGGLGAWLLAGAALRPVERLWREPPSCTIVTRRGAWRPPRPRRRRR